jgi:hypothetical protein
MTRIISRGLKNRVFDFFEFFIGGFGYFSLKLKLISEYPDLIPQVFQHFREWGNSIVILNLFDIALVRIQTHTHTPSLAFTIFCLIHSMASHFCNLTMFFFLVFSNHSIHPHSLLQLHSWGLYPMIRSFTAHIRPLHRFLKCSKI